MQFNGHASAKSIKNQAVFYCCYSFYSHLVFKEEFSFFLNMLRDVGISFMGVEIPPFLEWSIAKQG